MKNSGEFFPMEPANPLSEVVSLNLMFFPVVLVKNLGGLVRGYGGGVLGPGLLGPEGDHDGRGVQRVPHPDIGFQQLWCVLHDAHIKDVGGGGLGSVPLEEVILVPEEVIQGLQLLQNKKINF